MNEKPKRIIIEPGRTEKNYWNDLWRFRELLFILSWRDIKVRYRQTKIGIAWAILRPMLTMGILLMVFNRFVGLSTSDGQPYAILVFAGQLPWMFFATALSDASNSLIVNERLITKVYFPRMIIPLSSIATSLLDFLISTVLLFLIMLYYGVEPTWRILFLPVFFFLVFLAALGAGLFVAALNVQFRDFRYIIPFIVQFGLYLSPVGYSISRVPEKWQYLFSLNPIVGIIDGFRWSIIGEGVIFLKLPFWISMGVILMLLGLGLFQFRKMEKSFADLI
jgi:lipopolysaccharide transport system permease protein